MCSRDAWPSGGDAVVGIEVLSSAAAGMSMTSHGDCNVVAHEGLTIDLVAPAQYSSEQTIQPSDYETLSVTR